MSSASGGKPLVPLTTCSPAAAADEQNLWRGLAGGEVDQDVGFGREARSSLTRVARPKPPTTVEVGLVAAARPS